MEWLREVGNRGGDESRRGKKWQEKMKGKKESRDEIGRGVSEKSKGSEKNKRKYWI